MTDKKNSKTQSADTKENSIKKNKTQNSISKDSIKNSKGANLLKKNTTTVSKSNSKNIDSISSKVEKSKDKQVAETERKVNPLTEEEIEKLVEEATFKNVKAKRGIAGLGLFAEEDIKKGERIIEYIGNTLLGQEAIDAPANMYLFEVSRNKTIDGSPRWNKARYINHSCDGNAESETRKGRVFIQAIKNIKKGEEITYDYGEEFFLEYCSDCKCGAKKHKYLKNKK
jgi:hypothetical protein